MSDSVTFLSIGCAFGPGRPGLVPLLFRRMEQNGSSSTDRWYKGDVGFHSRDALVTEEHAAKEGYVDRHDPTARTLHGWLAMFLEGWRTGDAKMILQSVADDFVYDDPIDGRFQKDEFGAYLEELLGSDEARSRAAEGANFEDISEIVMQEKDGELAAWGWWKTESEEGAGLVKVGLHGVRLERAAYYSIPGAS
jgi:hypothetical protein